MANGSRGGAAVAKYRRRLKEKLVAHKGNKCFDCGLEAPPFIFEFDHRDPTQKSFGLSTGGLTRSKAACLAEAEKCDLVCPTCHRWRTHRQRCAGCKWCEVAQPVVQRTVTAQDVGSTPTLTADDTNLQS